MDYTDKQLLYSVLLGSFIGFIPHNTFLDSMLFIVFIFSRFNIVLCLIAAIIFYVFYLILLPLLNALGVIFLFKVPLLTVVIKCIYHIPFVAYLNLNYTVVCGAYVFYIALFYFLNKLARKSIPLLQQLTLNKNDVLSGLKRNVTTLFRMTDES